MSMLPSIERLKEMPQPFELLDLDPDEEKCFTAIGWDLGKATIKPRWPGAPEEKTVLLLRIYVPPEEKQTFPYYWDTTAATLVPQLYTILIQAKVPPNRITICVKKIGTPPTARFTVRTVPAQQT